ncbi:MAG: hypothetical protein HKN77_04165 [Woeseiaceae bacterium]|nr:hypothetical protein [Woeseiaceae bacterium]
MNNKDFKEIPRSETTISQKLADIQKRCSELMQENAELDALSLEDMGVDHDWNNPYSRG